MIFIFRCYSTISIVFCIITIYLYVLQTVTANPCVTSQLTAFEPEYSEETGKCYYYLKTSVERLAYNKSYSDAASTCNTVIAQSGVATFPVINRLIDTNNMVKFIFKKGYGVDVWTHSTCNSSDSRFHWLSDNSLVDGYTDNCTTGEHLMFRVSYSSVDYIAMGSFVTMMGGFQIFLCEYSAPMCNPATVSGWNAARMETAVTPYPNVIVKLKCKSGYYRVAEKGLPSTSNRNKFNCTYKPGTGIGTSVFEKLDNLNLDFCEPMHCKGWKLINETIIPDVNVTYKQTIVTSKEYLYGEKIYVQCDVGYVNALNESDTNAFVKCGQNPEDPSQGQWDPPLLVVCLPVRCSSDMPAVNTTFISTYKAFDRIKSKTYTEFQTNKFPYYPNVVYVKCATKGYFFKDRKYDKAFQCVLPSNGSRTIGVWEEHDGTIAIPEVMQCQPITCLTKEIVIPSAQADFQDYLVNRANFNPNVTVRDPFGVTTVVDMSTFAKKDYGYENKVTIRCLDNHETTEKANLTEVYCSSSGTWDKQAAACIKQSAALSVAQGKKYVPPAKEAGQAQSLGMVVIVILVVFFLAIIILDLTTLSRDIKLMKRNLKRIKDRSMSRKGD